MMELAIAVSDIVLLEIHLTKGKISKKKGFLYSILLLEVVNDISEYHLPSKRLDIRGLIFFVDIGATINDVLFVILISELSIFVDIISNPILLVRFYVFFIIMLIGITGLSE